MNDMNSNHSLDLPDEVLANALGKLIEGRQSRPGAPFAAAATDQPVAEPGLCPEPVEWLPLVSGATRPAESSAKLKPVLVAKPESAKRESSKIDDLMAHAAMCGPCAESLRTLTAEATPQEAAEVASLASASRDWQRNLAVELARTPHQAARKAHRFYMRFGAGIAASLLIAGAVTFVWQRANTPERMLAEAYSHSRVFDLRIPGAGFAEVTPDVHLRGSETGRESSRLLDARANIERHLENAPEDAHWLQLEARADILEEKFDPAIDILDRLLAAGPVTSSLLMDDAAAYYQRGVSAGNENDRATALEHLRHADELAPGDPVVLFNEAIAMEDRGQVMNAVETWNRYLRFERDQHWLAEGRRRLQALEQKLNQLNSHQSRMDQHLASPQAMRSLAADPAALASLDEELSSTLLPRLLEAAFPIPAARNRGSPCTENCLAARTLLHALAASLETNHQDPWLTQLLPSDSSPPTPSFLQAADSLAHAIDADVQGDYPAAVKHALQARLLFHSIANAAGEDRAQVEQSYALSRTSNPSGCYSAAHPLLGRQPQFVWIQIHALTQDTLCDPAPGTAAEDNPAFLRAVSQAEASHYALLELRARNLLGAAAVDSGDAEAAWRAYLPTVRRFYSGDFPAMRLYATLSGLEQVEQATPRIRSALLLQREVVAVLGLTQSKQLIPTERLNLAAAAIRAGSAAEAQEQMRLAQSELAANGGGKSVQGYLAETEIGMATLYLERRDLPAAAAMLDAANTHMAGERNSYHERAYAVARGQLELAQGHLDAAEPLLRNAILEEERLAGKAGSQSIVQAQQDRDLYAVLAGVWLAQGRPGKDVLALWERYRLRILGESVPTCPAKALACLEPQLSSALAKFGADQVLGQIVLTDRLLLYRGTANGVTWSQRPIRSQDVLAAAALLELAVKSPTTPMASVDQAARRVGALLVDPVDGLASARPAGQFRLEPDPLLGNLPWPSVATAAGPIGLHSNLEESPSLLLPIRPEERAANSSGARVSSKPFGKPLIVGASIASGENQLLPEVLVEARAVARFDSAPNVLLGAQATQPQIVARLSTASAIHFAGHAAEQDGATRLLLAPMHPGSAQTAPAPAASTETGSGRPWLDSDLLRKYPPRAARLAVFSACSTGKKEEGWNHGMGDIVATLASLGVPDVVATRWQIDSSSAVPMMDAFYGGLANGLTVPQALTEARLTLIRDPRYHHPYYWAAWYASGTGNSDLSPLFRAVN